MIQTLITHTANANATDAEQIITVMVLSAKETETMPKGICLSCYKIGTVNRKGLCHGCAEDMGE